MIITISGRPGAGKSVVARRVAQVLGMRHLSAGDFMRQMAEERGVSILALSRTAENQDSIDREIDARTVRLGVEDNNFVLDARLGWHFIPHSIKVFLDVRPEVAATRIFGAGRGEEPENVDLEATMSAMATRAASEEERYRTYYGVDYLEPGNYDLIVDTSDLDPDEVVERVLSHIDLVSPDS